MRSDMPWADDPLGWIDPALEDLTAGDLRRELRHLAGPAGPWVTLEDGRKLLHLCSNNYLGLATNPRVVAAARAAVRTYGTGAGASRLVTGGQKIHREFEEELAAWKGTGAAVLFSSGYLANLGVVTALVGAGDTVVSDELNHASIVDACRLSRAEVRVYQHRDFEHAAALLARAPGRRLLVTDGVFSMDGDLAPLEELCDAAERHNAALVVDDAHGSAIIGPDGRGTAAALGCEGRVHAVVGTLSKALGSTGGFVATSRAVAKWLHNRARPFIFDTAPSGPAIAAAQAALRIARASPDRRQRALRLARRLADGLRAVGVAVNEPEACIVPIPVGDNRGVLDAMEGLVARGVLVVAIRPPSVPDGTARLRATVMATHSEADVELAVSAFARVLRPALSDPTRRVAAWEARPWWTREL
ncbi:MAG: 8-amino-7-oxononanoate synthase [Actinomycetota bacterium]|nr:8-amino-7-oxononanoate synthase [Actinomycetota bacterium]